MLYDHGYNLPYTGVRVYVQGRFIKYNGETSLEWYFNTILVSACDLFPAEFITIHIFATYMREVILGDDALLIPITRWSCSRLPVDS